MSVVTGMTTDDEKKRAELKKQQEELSRELQTIREKSRTVKIEAFTDLEERARKTRKDIRDLEKL